MKQAIDNSEDKDIMIYQNVWKNVGLALGSLAFALIGYFIIFHDNSPNMKRYIAGWGAIIFFGGGGIVLLAINIYNKIRNIPLLIIGKDRLEMYVQIKGKYDVLHFSEIDGFRYILFGKSRMIAVDYSEEAKENKYKNSSKIVQKMMGVNEYYTDAPLNIPADNLTMKGDDIYAILNDRFTVYKSLGESPR